MTPLERYNAWVRAFRVRYPNQSGVAPGMTYERAKHLALQIGHSQADINRAIAQQQHFLAKNEHNKKANKKLWGKFFLNWLAPKSYQQTGRLEPSDFGE